MKSTVSTVVSVVRLGTELPAPEFAKLIGKPYSTLKSLESGRLKLSERTALDISKATGVGLAWLLSGDPQEPPTTDQGEPWTRETFDRVQALDLKRQLHQAHRSRGKSKTKEEEDAAVKRSMTVFAVGGVIRLLTEIQDEDQFTIALAKVNRFVADLERDLKK